MKKLIEVDNLTKVYGKGDSKTVVLKDLSFDLDSGESLCVIGPSGSGKSTLLHILGGLDNPTSGKVSINGQLLNELNDKELSTFRNKTIGFVFQFFYLQDYLTAKENVILPAKIASGNPSGVEDRAMELLRMVGLGHRLDHYPNEMSGGEMQRVAIARALINTPRLLLADEPTGNLDKDNADKVIEILDEIHERGVSVILVTHDEKLGKKFDTSFHVEKGVLVNNHPANQAKLGVLSNPDIHRD
ncbi:ABC transporter ATP-binding protein [Patescibacteria group bacterium]|nr:ABC transporter ATP-binding protein [Patescibacteria group bacterium]